MKKIEKKNPLQPWHATLSWMDVSVKCSALCSARREKERGRERDGEKDTKKKKDKKKNAFNTTRFPGGPPPQY